MDLIREELLRQEKALELLLLGAGPQPESQTQESLWQKRQADGTQSSETADLDAGEASPAGSWVIRAPREIWHEESSGTVVPRETLAGKTFPPAAGEMLERDATGYGVTAGVIPAKAAAAGGRSAGSQPQDGTVVTEYVLAGKAPGIGAQELSRTFERDARRYDGGFTS